MKNLTLFIIAVIITLSSCTEDKGTYDYTPLNEVVIGDVGDHYLALSEKPFEIHPTIEQSVNADEGVLEYLWYSYENFQTDGADTLGFEKDLVFDELPLMPNSYNLVLKVTDTSTGIFYNYKSILDVKGFPDGLHVLSNSNGDAQLSIIRGEGINDYEAYKLKNGEVAGTDPVCIKSVYKSRNSSPYQFAILCNDNGLGVFTEPYNFEKIAPITDSYGSSDDVPSNVTGMFSVYNMFVGFCGIEGDNNFYTGYLPGGWAGPNWSQLYIFENISTKYCIPNYPQNVFFNQETTGFVAIDTWGYMLTPLPGNDEDIFDMSNTGLKVVYGKPVMEYGMGVFEDEVDGTKYLLGTLGYKPAFKKEIVETTIDDAVSYDFMNRKQVLLYAAGNSVYTYDVMANKLMYVCEFASEVTCIEVSTDDDKIFVGLSNGTNAANSGSIYVMDLDIDGEVLSVLESYEDVCGKIVDFNENY